MDPLTWQRTWTLFTFVASLANATLAAYFVLTGDAEVAVVPAFVSGFTFFAGLTFFVKDRKASRSRNEVMERFLRPRFDKDTFGGWRSHGRKPGPGETERR